MNALIKKIYLFIKIMVFDIYLFFCGLYIRLFKVEYLLFMAPFHENLGDHAITLSQEQLLAERGIKAFEIHTKALDYGGSFFAKMVPNSTVILLNGGGFLGSLWKHEERRVRKIFTEFSSNKIVVFPQTVTFADSTDEDRAYFEESKKIYSMNKNLTIFVREKNSLAYMKEKMPEVHVEIAPDIVTRLKNPNSKDLKRSGFILCFRKDKEQKVTADMKTEVLELLKAKYGSEEITYTDTVIDHFVNKAARENEVNAKLAQFGSAKLVITDRLHGMIMAAITNTPCIAFGNSNGKVKNVFYWIKDNEFVKYVDSMEQFKEALDSLDLNKEYKYHIDETLFYELAKTVQK